MNVKVKDENCLSQKNQLPGFKQIKALSNFKHIAKLQWPTDTFFSPEAFS